MAGKLHGEESSRQSQFTMLGEAMEYAVDVDVTDPTIVLIGPPGGSIDSDLEGFDAMDGLEIPEDLASEFVVFDNENDVDCRPFSFITTTL